MSSGGLPGSMEQEKQPPLSFDVLPPRVIVHDILCFYEFEISWRDEVKPSCLFGYFKLDKLRNIWFVFTSLLFEEVDCKNVIMDISKIHSIDGHDLPLLSLLLTKHSQKMNSLRRISLGSSSKDHEILTIKFPKLTSFEYFNEKITKYNVDWNHFFYNIKILSISGIYADSFFEIDEKKFNNIQKLKLSYIKLNKPVEVEVPNLRSLKMMYCKNLVLLPTNRNLKELRLFECERESDIIPLLESSPLLRILEINLKNNSDGFIFRCDFSFLTGNRLEQLYLGERQHLVFHLNEKQYQIFSRNIPNHPIRKLFHDHKIVESLGKDFLHLDFPKLEELQLVCKPPVVENTEFKWSFSDRLVNLILCESAPNRIFENNSFVSLKVLQLYLAGMSHTVTGIGWKSYEFPHLHLLDLMCCPFFSDTFFQNFKGKNLKKIVITRPNDFKKDVVDDFPYCIRGRDWSECIYSSLVHLAVYDCFFLEDSLFQKMEFSKLRELRIGGIDNRLAGEKWKNMVALSKRYRESPITLGLKTGYEKYRKIGDIIDGKEPIDWEKLLGEIKNKEKQEKN